MSDPATQLSTEIVADGAAVRVHVLAGSVSLSFAIATDSVPHLAEMLLVRHRVACAMRAAAAPPDPPTASREDVHAATNGAAASCAPGE